MINVRKKGHDFERKIATMLKDTFPNVKRHLEMQESDCIGVDLDNTGNLAIQCKKGKQVPKKIYDYYKQVLVNRKGRNVKVGMIKVVVMARDNETPMAMLSVKDFKDLLNGRVVIP